jgi:hypothetical protein
LHGLLLLAEQTAWLQSPGPLCKRSGQGLRPCNSVTLQSTEKEVFHCRSNTSRSRSNHRRHDCGPHANHNPALIVEPLVQIVEPLIHTSIHVIEAMIHVIEALVDALIHVIEAMIHVIEALVDALIHVIEAMIHVIEALVDALIHVIEAMIHVIEALVDVNQVLLPCLFGMRKTLFHPLFNTKEPLGDANGEFLEVFFPDKFICHGLPFLSSGNLP